MQSGKVQIRSNLFDSKVSEDSNFGSKIVSPDRLVVDHVNAGEDVFIVVNNDYAPSGTCALNLDRCCLALQFLAERMFAE
jgi:hypothetical protein